MTIPTETWASMAETAAIRIAARRIIFVKVFKVV
jgi:hypothetical protein